MESFRKSCPHCGKDIKASADICKYCRGDVSEAATARAAAAAAGAPHPETKQCPYCAEQVRWEAQVCRFCQRNLATPTASAVKVPPKGAKYCQACGTIAQPKRHTKGSFAIEVVAWLFFLLPGIIYSLWRLTSKQWICPNCGSVDIIPLDSPKARAALAGAK